MNKLLLIIFLIVSFHFKDAVASSNCVFVVFGGAKDWGTILPGIPTDVSIDIDHIIKKEANKTGCEVLAMANDTEEDFLEKLKKLKKNKPGMNYHLAFTDHGINYNGKGLDSLLVTGKGQSTTYKKFFEALKENIPKGSHITYETHYCWSRMGEMIIESQLDSHFEICGGSSSSPEVLSWHSPSMSKNERGQLGGPYGGVGLNFANQHLKKKRVAPSFTEFHFEAKKGDVANLIRNPGLTTSLTYVKNVLQSKNIKVPLVSGEIGEVLSEVYWKDDQAVDNFLKSSSVETINNLSQYFEGQCPLPTTKTPFNDFIRRITPIYTDLMEINFSSLPEPYKTQSIDAKSWLEASRKNLITLLTKFATEKAQFIVTNRSFPREKFKKTEDEWKELKQKQMEALREYAFNLRIVQEGKMLQKFMMNSTPEEQARFKKLLECEQKPMF